MNRDIGSFMLGGLFLLVVGGALFFLVGAGGCVDQQRLKHEERLHDIRTAPPSDSKVRP